MTFCCFFRWLDMILLVLEVELQLALIQSFAQEANDLGGEGRQGDFVQAFEGVGQEVLTPPPGQDRVLVDDGVLHRAVEEAEEGFETVVPDVVHQVVLGLHRVPIPPGEGHVLPAQGGDFFIPAKELLVLLAPGIGGPVVGVPVALDTDLVAVVDAGHAGEGHLDETQHF